MIAALGIAASVVTGIIGGAAAKKAKRASKEANGIYRL